VFVYSINNMNIIISFLLLELLVASPSECSSFPI